MVVPLDADRRVDAEPARALPGEHVCYRGLVEEIVAAEVPEDASLHGPLDLLPVARFEFGSLVGLHPTLVGLREDPVEDDDVVVEMGVETRTEAVQERDSADLDLRDRRRSPGTRGVQGGADGTEEDLEDPACNLRVAVQVGSQPFRNREHPLPDGKLREDPIGQVGRDLGHATCVARGADTSPFAAEREEPLMPAGVASDTSESVGQDAASLVRSEVSLDPGRHAPASGVFVPGRGEKGLEVVLDDGVERSRRGATRSVDESRRTRWQSVRWRAARRGCLTPPPFSMPER